MEEKNVIDLWFHYEQIAMHFNTLIIQYRLQLMGATGAIGALSAFLISNKITNSDVKLKLQFVTSLIILVLFSAAAYLDLFYYSKLLSASVDVIIKFEDKYEYLNMSNDIKLQFPYGGSTPIRIVYGIIFICILSFTYYSSRVFKKR